MLSQRFNYKAITLAVVSSLNASSVLANDTKEEAIEQITVWSTQINTSSLYLQEGDIAEKQADHISDLLRSIPGVDVGGAHSLNQRITIRSLDDRDLNITIDGAQQNTYMYHHMGNLQIHADILKSVDIDIGTNSILSQGLGGAVRFETKNAKELLSEGQSFGARVHLGYGDNSADNYSLTAYGLLGESVDYIAYYNQVDNKNYDVGGGEILDAGGNVIDGTDGTVRGLEGEVSDILVKFGWDIDDNQRIKLGYERYVDEGNYSYRPDMGLATDLAITESLGIPLLWPTEFTRDTLTLNYDANLGESTHLMVSVFSNTSELYRDESGYAQNPAFAAWAALVTGDAKNSGVNILANTTIDGNLTHDLTYGLNYILHDTSYHAAYPDDVNEVSDEESTTLAIFAQDRITLSDNFTVIAGVRAERYDIDSNTVDDSYTDGRFSLAVEYQPASDLLFKLSSTELFKGPEIAEVFIGAGLYDDANPDIEAETGLNTELSFAYLPELSNGATFSIGATLFNTQINDYIYDYTSAGKDNIGDMQIRGVEAYIGYSTERLQAQLN